MRLKNKNKDSAPSALEKKINLINFKH